MGYCMAPVAFRDTLHPCRKCQGCHRWRQYQWRYRLTQESLTSTRTWFCTWTSSTEMTEHDWTHSWQKFMKRLRKSLETDTHYSRPPTVRYFTVMEKGSMNSRLHLHSLMFCSDKIRKRDIELHWKAGFSALALADPGSIRYVSKYVTKEAFRICASQNLGLLTSSPQTHPAWYRRLAIQRSGLLLNT